MTLNPISWIKDYGSLVIGIALVTLLSVQTFRLQVSKTETAQEITKVVIEKKIASDLRAERSTIIAEATKRLSLQAAEHAKTQQDIVYAHNQITLERDAADRIAFAGSRRVRDQLKAYAAASADQPGGANAQACRNESDKAGKLAALLGEGHGLVAEGRSIIGKQAGELTLLLKLIENDEKNLRK